MFQKAFETYAKRTKKKFKLSFKSSLKFDSKILTLKLTNFSRVLVVTQYLLSQEL